jgi:pantothenate kinase
MNYIITPSSVRWILNDLDRIQKQQLLGHVNAQDYFGTLATVLSLMKQNNQESLSMFDTQVVDEAVEELSYLQQNYCITEE